MVKNYPQLFVFLFCLGCNLSGFSQLKNSGSFITNNGSIIAAPSFDNAGRLYNVANGAIYVSGDVAVSDSMVFQNATMRVGGDYTAAAGAVSVMTGVSEFDIVGDFSNQDGHFHQSATSKFVLSGLNQLVEASALSPENDFFGEVSINGGGRKLVSNALGVRGFLFNDGIISASSAADTLFVIANTPISVGSNNSHVQGALFLIVPPGFSGQLNFPVGTTLTGVSTYFPLQTVGFSAGIDSSVFKVEVLTGAISTPQFASTISSLYTGVYWQMSDYNPTHHSPFSAKVTASEALVGSTADSWVLTQSATNTTGSEFISIGSSDFVTGTNAYVTSNANYSANFLAIGTRCNTAKLQLRASLQGVVAPSLVYQRFLDTVFVQGLAVNGVSSLQQTSGFDNSTLDVVNILIRDAGNPSIAVDSVLGWLLADGSVLDFTSSSKPFVEYCPKAGGVVLSQDYYVELQHKNHLPVINSTSNMWTASSLTPESVDVLDFTLPSTHFSIGGYFASGTRAEMIAGNANNTGESRNRITPIDVEHTVFRMHNLPAIGFYNEDHNLDGAVNTLDYNLVRDNSVYARRAVLPY